MPKYQFLAILILYVFLFSACGVSQSFNTVPTPTLIPTVTPTLTPIPNSCSKTPKIYKTFSMPESWRTISDSSGEDDNLRKSYTNELETNLVDYLNHNGTPYQLQNDLRYLNGVIYADIREYDFDKDGENEVLMAIEVNKIDFSEVYLLIAKCKQTNYQLITKMDNFGELGHSPRILLIKDLNNDGYSEVVWKTTWVGSDTSPFVNVLSWDNNTQSFVDIFKPNRIPLGDVKITIGDIDNKGIDEIIFYGRYEHWGDQMVTCTYSWDGKVYKETKEELAP